jgi:hypothetical protein
MRRKDKEIETVSVYKIVIEEFTGKKKVLERVNEK